MTDNQPQENNAPKFVVQMAPDKAPEAARSLRKTGVDFVPAQDMQALARTPTTTN